MATEGGFADEEESSRTTNELETQRAWFKRAKEEVELKSLRAARQAYEEEGDESALYQVVIPDKIGAQVPIIGGSNLLPRPESHHVYKARDRTDYNNWVRDCESSFSKSPSLFVKHAQKIAWGYSYIEATFKNIWDLCCKHQTQKLGYPCKPTWLDFKSKMLDQLGTLYERQMAAADAIKNARQRSHQSPTELLNYLRPQWDELEQDNVLTQVFDFYNALLPDLRAQLELIPHERRDTLPTMEEQANIIWRRLRSSSRNSTDRERGRKRGYDDNDDNHSQNQLLGHKKARKGASKERIAKSGAKPHKSSYTPKESITCWNCGKKGHKKPGCRQEQIGDGLRFRPEPSLNDKGRK